MSFIISSRNQASSEAELKKVKAPANIEEAIVAVNEKIKAVAEEKDDYEWQQFECGAAARRTHWSTKIGECEAALETLRASRAELKLELARVQREDAERRRAAQRHRDARGHRFGRP
jgi:hypothetical protein